jgi:Fe-S cluster assembly protein SufD
MRLMTANSYFDSLLAGLPQQHANFSSPASGWLTQLRANAVERVGALTVPTTRDEDWRFTDLSPLTQLPWHPAQDAPQLARTQLDPLALPEAAARLVFVDGRYAPEHSFNHAGLTVEDLAAGNARYGALIEAHLGQHAGFEHDAFTALNTAFLHGGALIVASPEMVKAGPVHLLYVATQKETTSYPRCLVIAQPGAELTLVEEFVALCEDAYFTNAVTEIALAHNAQVNHIRVQQDSGAAFHIATCAVSVAQGSHYNSVSIALGARLSRYNLNVLLAQEGAQCTIDGLAAIGGRQLADSHTRIDHTRPHGTSRQLHKCIVGGAAHAVFNGQILVRPGAQRTDSSQSSRNLLLSGKARVDTKPQLEIFADDVKCAHGATVGQLDGEEVFYLRSRGLSDAAARRLLTYAFGAEVIARIAVPSLRNRLEQTLLEQTSLDQSGQAS